MNTDMAQNKKSEGLNFTYVLGAGETTLKSGDIYFVGNTVGVISAIKRNGQPVTPDMASAQGDIIVVDEKGVYELPKDAAAIGFGVDVYVTTATRKVSATAAGGILLGQSRLARLAGDALCLVKLKG